ncbi:KxYKxGKxW signal peptide domain-containing protein, partial [Secundilactobacillus silagincola]|uniref:KxYKxGKxW signal peptide domain-containing protein n=1 Tax=Secundilactobacillus silagincola TaxID=1714681 RepID=UPI0015D4C49E
MKCNETRHYKMYKAGKNFLFASISMMAMGSWMFLNQTAYADVKPSVAITAQVKTPTSSTNSDQAGTQSSAASGSTTQGQSTDGSSTDQKSNEGSSTDTATATTQANTSTSTSTKETATGNATNNTAQPQFKYEVDATSETSNVDQSNASAAQTDTPTTTSNAPTSLKTIDQLNGEYIDDKGDVSKTKPAPATGGGQTASTADMSKDVTGDLTAVTDNGNTYYTTTDGNFSGQGGQNNKDATPHVVVATKGQQFDNFGKVYRDSKQKQWVLLAADTTGAAGSYSFKNQIDTTSNFDIQGEWYMSKNDPGGGVGIILQPVNPQLAGIGSSSNAAIDIGIQGQKDTTFLGFDGYTSGKKNDHDTAPGTLTIRQTDSQGSYDPTDGGGFNNLTLDTTNSVNAQYVKDKNTNQLDDDSPYATVGENEGDTLDVLFDVNWKPNDGSVGTDGNVTGTLAVSAYNPSGSTTDKPLGKIVTDNVKLPSASSIALFGALGGSGAGVTVQGRITSYDLQQVSQKVSVNYLNIDTGATVKAQTQINANVGNTLDVEETTSGTSASYGAPVISGWTFVGAVGTDTTGNYQQTTMDVVNTSTLPDDAKGTYNTINVYYKKVDANAKSRTVAPYTTPDGTSVPEASQASVGATSIPAVKAGTTTPITDAKGNPIDLSTTLKAIPIQQVAGYVSGYTTGGGTFKAATAIPSSNGSDAGTTYTVQYESTSPKLADVTIPEGATPQIGLAASDNTVAPTVSLTRDDVTVTQDGNTISGAYSSLIAGKYEISLTASGQAKVVAAYGVDASKLDFTHSAGTLMVGTTTLPVQKDSDGGTTQITIDTKTKNVIMVDKTWSDGDVSHVEINTTDNTATLTETDNGGSAVGPQKATINQADTVGATTLVYHGTGQSSTDKMFDLTHVNAKATTSDNQQVVTIATGGDITYVNKGTYDQGLAAGKADYAAGKTEQTSTQLTTANNSTDYISGYQQGYESTEGTHDGTALGETGATNPGDMAGKSQIYQDAYKTAFNTASGEYKSGFAAGGSDATASKDKVDTSTQTVAYQNGYTAGYDTNAGAAAGKSDGSVGEAAVDNSTKSQTYQNAYAAAYNKAKDTFDGTQAGNSDGSAGKPAADNSKQSTDYQTAYSTAYTTAKASYDNDYQAGDKTGLAGQPADPTKTSAGYSAGYAAGQQSYTDDKKTGSDAGTADGSAGKPAADLSKVSQGYKDGYTATYPAAKATYD